MPTRIPIDDSARARLRSAQKAEATALREVEATDRVRQRAQQALNAAEATLREAQLELVRVSGPERAARLLDIPVERLPSVAKAKRQQSPAPAEPDRDPASDSGAP